MNTKKRKKFFALSACLMAALLNSVSIVNAFPPDSDSSDDDSEDMPISIVRNPLITDPNRRSSSFMVPQFNVPMGPAQQAISGENENLIPDELKTPLNIPEDINDAVTTKIPDTGIEISQSDKFNNLQNYNSTKRDGTVQYNEVYTISDGVVNYNKPVFVRTPIIISGPDCNPESRPKVYFEWLTISSAVPVIFRNLDISGKIQATAKANIIFENCNIHHTVPKKAECAVEIFAGSKAKFENCILDAVPSATVCVVVRDKCWNGPASEACFNNCKFGDCKIGVFSMGSANLRLFNCEFSKCNNISVFLTKDTNTFIKNCKFTDMNGKAIFLKDKSNVEIEDCKFLRCKKGAITGAEHSKAKLVGCDIFETENTAIRFLRGCKFNISRCRTSEIAGNCLNIESSNGHVGCCTFSSDAPHPIVALIGPNSFPIIENCSIEQLATKSNAGIIVVKDSASPILKGVSVKYVDGTAPGMTCGKLSRPTLIGTNFEIINSKKVPEIRVFDASKLKLFVGKDDIDFIKENVTDLSLLDPSKKYFNVVEKRHGGVAFLLSNKEIDCNEMLPLDRESDDEFDDDSDNKPDNEPVDELDNLLGDNKFDEGFYNAIDSMCHKISDDDRIIPILPCAHVLRSCPKCNSENIIFDPNTNELTCEDCKSAIDFSKMDFRCPICKRRVDDNEKLHRMWEVDSTCLICLENPATNFFMNCGHKCVCSNCKQKLLKKGFGENCPCCNESSNTSGIDFLSDDDE